MTKNHIIILNILRQGECTTDGLVVKSAYSITLKSLFDGLKYLVKNGFVDSFRDEDCLDIDNRPMTFYNITEIGLNESRGKNTG